MKFKLSETTRILHHDARFDRVKVCLNMQNIRYANGSKPVMLISTMNSLRTRVIDREGIVHLNEWMKSNFSDERIESKTVDNDLYLVTRTAKGSIFLYMILDNFGIRSQFRKVPQTQDAMTVRR